MPQTDLLIVEDDYPLGKIYSLTPDMVFFYVKEYPVDDLSVDISVKLKMV